MRFAIIITRQNTKAIFISLSFAVFLMLLPIDGFQDRIGYLDYANHSGLILLGNIQLGLKRLLFNEPLWLVYNITLRSIFSSESVIRSTIFISAFFSMFLILIKHPRNILFVLLLFLLPSILKNYIVHLRQGLAVAIFLYAYYTTSSYKKFFFLTAALLVHASFFVIVFFYVLTLIIKQLPVSSGVSLFVVFFVAVFSCISVLQVASLLGARQGVGFASTNVSISGLGFLFWLSFFGIYLSCGPNVIKMYLFELFTLLFYLLAYFTLPISARIFESALLLLLLPILVLKNKYKYLLIGMLVCFTVLQWLISAPSMFGFKY